MPGPLLAGAAQSLDQSLNTVISEFKLLEDAAGVMEQCSTHYSLPPHSGVSKIILNYGRALANNITDGVDIAQAQQITDAQTTITPGEVVAQIIVGGRTRTRVADTDLDKNMSAVLMNALRLKIDQDGTGQISSFTPTLGGSVVFTPGLAAAAGGRLGTGNSPTIPEPAPKPWCLVAHPLSLVALAGTLVPYSSTPGGAAAYGAAGGAHAGTTIGPAATGPYPADIIHGGYEALGELAGARVYADANVTVSGANAVNGFFSKAGVLYCTEVAPKLDTDTSDVSMRGAVELNAWASYGWAVYRPAAYGIAITADASLATS